MSQRPVLFLWIPALLVLSLLLTACQMLEPTPTPGPAEAAAAAEAAVEAIVDAYPLAATAWELAYFGEPDTPFPMLPETRATLTLFWDRYMGFDGCNWFLGAYAATTDGELSLFTPARTPDVCGPEALFEQATMYTSALLNVTRYELDGDQLVTYSTGDQRMVTFNNAPPVPALGTTWDLKFWWHSEREQWYPVLPLSVTTLEFGEGGEASGSGGCNDFTVTYAGDLQIEKVMEATATYAELPTLTFGPITSAMTTCAEPEDIMTQEQAYFVALGSVAYYFRLGGMLMLLDSEGMPLLVFGARF